MVRVRPQNLLQDSESFVVDTPYRKEVIEVMLKVFPELLEEGGFDIIPLGKEIE